MKKLILGLLIGVMSMGVSASYDFYKYYVDNAIEYHKMKIETMLMDKVRTNLLPQVIVLPDVTKPIYDAINRIPNEGLLPIKPCRIPILNQDPYNTPTCR